MLHVLHVLSSSMLVCVLELMFCCRWSKLQWTLVGQQALRTLLCQTLASYALCQTGTAFLHPLKPLRTLLPASHLQINLPRQWPNCRYLSVGHAALLCEAACLLAGANLQATLCTPVIQISGRMSCTCMCQASSG